VAPELSDKHQIISPFNVEPQEIFKHLTKLRCNFVADYKPDSGSQDKYQNVRLEIFRKESKENEKLIGISLGHTVQFCIQMAKALDIVLKYPLNFNGCES